MKKIFVWVSLFFILSINAQEIGITGNSNWMNNWTNFKPKTTNYAEATNILSGTIEVNTTLFKKNIYQLVGIVYVAKNATLTIEPGTVIRGDYDTCGTLVITKGAKIIANGLDTDPIVFTSNKQVSNRNAGDWGGLIVQGDAPINRFGSVGSLDFNLDKKYNIYGGLKEDDNSGILKYVRIEFSGRKLNALKELNGLSLAGVGNKTVLDFIQISFSNDDSFEFYGGNVNVNNLISFRATDDDYDFTQGSQCSLNNSIAIRYPYSSDVARSRCLEVDSYDKIENFNPTAKLSKIIATNITLINNEDNDQGLVKEAINISNNSIFEIKNSIVSGFSQVMILDDSLVEDNSRLDQINFENTIFHNCKQFMSTKTIGNEKLLEEKYLNSNKNNIIISDKYKESLFKEVDIKKPPDFRMKVQGLTVNK